MRSLILGDLRQNWRLWAGSAVVMVFASVMFVACLTLFATADAVTDESVRPNVMNLAVWYTVINGLTALGVFTIALTTSVSLQQRNHALWVLAGLTPRDIAKVVYGQIGVLFTVCFLAGLLLAIPFVDYMVAFASGRGGNSELREASAGIVTVFSPWAFLGAYLLGLLIAVVSARPGVRLASRADPMALLRPVDPRAAGRLGWFRWVAVVVAAALAGFQLFTAVTDDRFNMNATQLFGMLLVVLFALTAKRVVPLVLSAWTRLVPRSAGPAWFLARRSAVHRGGLTSSAVTLLASSASFAGVYFLNMDVLAQLGRQQGRDPAAYEVALVPLLLMFSGPVGMLALSAAITVFMAGRDRGREFALVQSAGGTRDTLLKAALLEGLATVVTALLVVVAIVGASAVVAWIAGNAEGSVRPALGAVPVLVVLAGGTLFVLAASLLPARAALRTTVVDALRA